MEDYRGASADDGIPRVRIEVVEQPFCQRRSECLIESKTG